MTSVYGLIGWMLTHAVVSVVANEESFASVIGWASAVAESAYKANARTAKRFMVLPLYEIGLINFGPYGPQLRHEFEYLRRLEQPALCD
jgi:hypothetical protein